VTPPDLPTLRTLVQLQREFSDLFAQLSVLPYGSTQNYNASGGKSCEHPGGKQPAGESMPEAYVALERWERARWDAVKMRGVLTWMAEALGHWRRYTPPEKAEDPKALKREIQSKRGWTDREVAQAMRLTVREVHEARLAVKCCPAKGFPYVGCSVVELANRGNSVRQIEVMVGVSKSVVDRTLRKAA
jgi:hypothetical protein